MEMTGKETDREEHAGTLQPDAFRRGIVGFASGIVPGLVVASTIDPWLLGAALGPLFGAAYGVGFRIREGSTLDHALTSVSLSVPIWILVVVVVVPLIREGTPSWSIDAIGGLISSLPVWIVAGAVFGSTVSVLFRAVWASLGPVHRETSLPDVETRIVIVGGGFTGMAVARRLEARFGPDPTVELVLVNDTNSLLFTPMLAEVAAGTLEPTHVTTPLRPCLQRTRVIQAEATAVDVDARTVTLRNEDRLVGRVAAEPDSRGSSRRKTPAHDGGADLTYDHLVLALGSVPDYKGLDDVREFAFDFKTLQDAMEIRNHVISCFERADRTEDPEVRASLVTFVIAGAGFAGAELAGALNDFVNGILVYYPNVPPEEVTVTVVHSRDRIMPELSEPLAAYALDRMRERGVGFRLSTYVEGADVDAGTVSLTTGETIRTETVVWTAGNRPDPLVESLNVPQEETGAISVDRFLSLPEYEGVWAAGDCAAVPDTATGGRYPNTAEHAIRAGQVLADNVYASVTGKPKTPLEYESPGSLVVIGYQTACAELGNWRFSGLFAWILWRSVYLFKLPGLDRKIRVFVAWLIELVFPRDIVQTMGEAPRRGDDER